jgi:hypothetical protein
MPSAAFYEVPEDDRENIFQLLQSGAVKVFAFRSGVPLLGFIPWHYDWTVLELGGNMVLPGNLPVVLTEAQARDIVLHLTSVAERDGPAEVYMEGCGFMYTFGHPGMGEHALTFEVS